MNSNPDNKDPAAGHESDRRAGARSIEAMPDYSGMRAPMTREWIDAMHDLDRKKVGRSEAARRRRLRLQALEREVAARSEGAEERERGPA